MKNRKKMIETLGIEASDRCSGKTTGIALKTIGEALLNPGTEIAVTDHFPTRAASIKLSQVIAYYIYTLELEGVTMDTKKLSIRFDLEK